MANALKTYEFTFWLKPNAEAEAPQDALTFLKRQVVELGGEIVAEAVLARRRTGYPISKQTDGYFGVFTASLPTDAVEKYKAGASHAPQVLRLMVTTAPERAAHRTHRKTVPVAVNSSPDGTSVGTTETPDIKDDTENVGSLEEFDKRLEEILKT